MCQRVSYKKNMKIFFWASLKSLKKGTGSGSVSQGDGSTDPDAYQNVTDPHTAPEKTSSLQRRKTRLKPFSEC